MAAHFKMRPPALRGAGGPGGLKGVAGYAGCTHCRFSLRRLGGWSVAGAKRFGYWKKGLRLVGDFVGALGTGVGSGVWDGGFCW